MVVCPTSPPWGTKTLLYGYIRMYMAIYAYTHTLKYAFWIYIYIYKGAYGFVGFVCPTSPPWGTTTLLLGYIRMYVAIYLYTHPKICIWDVWACMLGVRTCICVSELVLVSVVCWCLNLYFWCLNLYLGV